MRPSRTGPDTESGAPGRSAAELSVSVAVPGDPAALRVAEPVTLGIPLAAGLCSDEQRIGVWSRLAGAIPVQARALERWPDGSIRWALLDFRANAPSSYDVRFDAAAVASTDALVIRHAGDVAEVDTAGLTFRAYAGGEFRLEARGTGRVARSVGIDVTRPDGTVLHPDVAELVWETTGPLHSVLRISAAVGAGGRQPLAVIVRLHFYAGSPTVRFDLTLWNPDRADHAGGVWALGDPGSLFIRDCTVRIETGPSGSMGWSAAPGESLRVASLPFELYQDSSGGDRWQSPVHVNRDGVVPVSFCGYRVKAGGERHEGGRATPMLWSEGPSGRTGLAMRYFWQNAPKGLEADDSQIALRLFPKQFADLHEIQGGERKTHVFHVAFGDDQVSALPLEWARRPALAAASADWYSSAGAVPSPTPVASGRHAEYDDLVRSVIDGPDRFDLRREAFDEYGWRHFGEIGDHTPDDSSGPAALAFHANNEDDAIAGFAYQFLRSSDARWWTAMEELAWHVRDIDVYHARAEAVYGGGIFGSTADSAAGGRSSHRARRGAPSAGPSPEHAHSTGLMVHYFLTGETASRDAAVGLAEWVLRIDDGRNTPLRWIWRGATGLASATGSLEYHGPGRGAANSIVALLDGFRLTGRAAFLEHAELLIRRCVHPHDDLAALGLDGPESRRSYTVFLQALGRYLEDKIGFGAIDDRYAYARACLLHYARWMAEEERSSLETPERPPDAAATWAIRDVRKSGVFAFAARHATGAERERFLERAECFFQSSLRLLSGSPGRSCARPRVALLGCGFLRAALQQGGEACRAPQGPPLTRPGCPSAFVPQRRAVERRLRRVCAGSLVGAAALLLLIAALAR